jgi:hypothetical protein
MNAKAFGFVVARGLAIYCFLASISDFERFWALQMVYSSTSSSRELNIPTIAAAAITLLLAAYLWTSAGKFSGTLDESQVSVRGGNWVVRLLFTALGLFIAIDAFFQLSDLVIRGAFIYRFSSLDSAYTIQICASVAKLLTGLGLWAWYRFDKGARLEAAQSVSQSTGPPRI